MLMSLSCVHSRFSKRPLQVYDAREATSSPQHQDVLKTASVNNTPSFFSPFFFPHSILPSFLLSIKTRELYLACVTIYLKYWTWLKLSLSQILGPNLAYETGGGRLRETLDVSEVVALVGLKIWSETDWRMIG